MLERPGLFRLFLACVVVVHHTTRFNLGTWAVFVFFVLSGYWISCMWDQKYRHCRRPARTFLISRYWRLAPTLILCMAVYFVAMWSIEDDRTQRLMTSLTDPAWLARTVAIISSSSQASYLTPKWSVDIEMQFYLAACLLFVVMGERRLTTGKLLCLTGGTILLFFLMQGRYSYPSVTLLPYAGLFCAGSFAYFSNWTPRRKWAITSIGIAAACVTILLCHPTGKYVVIGGPNVKETLHNYNEYASYLLALVCVPFAIWTVRQESPRWDRHLGNLAYPVYLFHMTPILVYRSVTSEGSFATRVVALSITYVAIGVGSLLMYWVFDRPIDRLRAGFVSRRLEQRALISNTVAGQPSNV